jgi:hypothetical protein
MSTPISQLSTMSYLMKIRSAVLELQHADIKTDMAEKWAHFCNSSLRTPQKGTTIAKGRDITLTNLLTNQIINYNY